MRVSSVLALNCLLLGTLVVGPKLGSLAGSPEGFDAQVASLTSRFDAIVGLAASLWMSLGFFSAFLVRQKLFLSLNSPGKFSLLAVLPALLLSVTFLFQPPIQVYLRLGEVFGMLAPVIFCFTTFLFGSFVYAIVSRELKRRFAKEE